MNILLSGKNLNLTPARAIGKGGEADIYSLGNGKALKLFKGPEHPDFQGQPDQQKMAIARLALQQKKLPAFPKGMPGRVVAPEALATDLQGGQILGYQMKLIDQANVLGRYSDQTFRLQGPNSNSIAPIFLDLHQTLRELHQAKVIIGDFNDLNILVRGSEAWLIDTDSFQFQNFVCPVFTLRFLDPLISNVVQDEMLPEKPFSAETDWFSFNVMLMECLLFVNPFGGVFRPKNLEKRIPHQLRPMERITVFNRDVRYPKNALPLETLPDQLLQHFYKVFEKDFRISFPEKLLKELFWKRCSSCGFEHARTQCPKCLAATPIRTRESVVIRGAVSARRIFSTSGRVLTAHVDGNSLYWLYLEGETFRREDGSAVLEGLPALGMKFGILNSKTLIGLRDSLIVLEKNGTTSGKWRVEVCDGVPQFSCSASSLFRLESGVPFCEKGDFPEPIGEILSGSSRFWTGSRFGLGFYRSAHLCVGFLFSTNARGLNDRVKLPVIPGVLIGANCWFSDSIAWLFIISRDQGRDIFQCVVTRDDGEAIGWLSEEETKNDWLKTLTGKCAVGSSLFAATDAGIVRIELCDGQIQETRRFPDTEPFVHSGCSLFPARGGLYVVDTQEINFLQISP